MTTFVYQWHDKSTRLKISKSLENNTRRLGIPHTKETRQRISDFQKGGHKTEETKQKMRESAKKAWIKRRACA